MMNPAVGRKVLPTTLLSSETRRSSGVHPQEDACKFSLSHFIAAVSTNLLLNLPVPVVKVFVVLVIAAV